MDAPQESIKDKGSGRARDRHKRRKQKQAMVVRGGSKRSTSVGQQIRSQDKFKLPTISLPKNKIIFGIPLGFLVVIGVIAGLALFKNSEAESFDNAIWVDKSWTYGDYTADEITEFGEQLKSNRIGTVYAYVSTLNINSNWSGGQEGKGSFMQSRDDVTDFVTDLKNIHPTANIYGWIEIWTTLDNDDGYRLDDEELQADIADFSRRMINELGFDGIFLDVKPLFTDNEDFLRLMRTVRASVGLDTPIAIAVPADLTPDDDSVAPVEGIAPKTMWDNNFKQRVMISANEIVITVYQSYRDNPLDYMNWVAYQVDTYVNLISELELNTDTKILVSIPNYQTQTDAHDPAIETIAAALDGINIGLGKLDEEMQPLLTGVAIFSDRDLNDAQWGIYQQKWLNR
jgi:hypothetical protein